MVYRISGYVTPVLDFCIGVWILQVSLCCRFELSQCELWPMCVGRSRLLHVDPCTTGGMWVHSATRGHRVGLILKGNNTCHYSHSKILSWYIYTRYPSCSLSLPSAVCTRPVWKCSSQTLFFSSQEKMQVWSELTPNCVSLGCIAFTDCLSNSRFSTVCYVQLKTYKPIRQCSDSCLVSLRQHPVWVLCLSVLLEP